VNIRHWWTASDYTERLVCNGRPVSICSARIRRLHPQIGSFTILYRNFRIVIEDGNSLSLDRGQPIWQSHQLQATPAQTIGISHIHNWNDRYIAEIAENKTGKPGDEIWI
jgi:hypothetical protein